MKFKGSSSKPRDGLGCPEKAVRRGAPDAENEFRFEDFNLRKKVRDTGIPLLLGRFAIVGRTAFHDVPDIAVCRARKADGREHLVEKVAGGTDKGPPLPVFFRAGTFSYHEYSRLRNPFAEDRMRASRGQITGRTVTHTFVECREADLWGQRRLRRRSLYYSLTAAPNAITEEVLNQYKILACFVHTC